MVKQSLAGERSAVKTNAPLHAATRPAASISLDLDNLWSYLKVHGESGWEAHPTYLPQAVPIILDFLQEHQLTITFFVVGQDALREENAVPIASIRLAGHELGNHSMNHESWMHTYDRARIEEEIGATHRAIESVADFSPVGFRGPGFAYSPTTLSVLKDLNYEYDCSLLPSSLGPVARLYYMWGSGMSREERRVRSNLFGRLSDGLLPLTPFEWNLPQGSLLEIPVTTMPLLRFQFHLSYVMWLSKFNVSLALTYVRTAIALCRARGVEPSFLLHPLDFLGQGDVKGLEFFPGMQLTRAHKQKVAAAVLRMLGRHHALVPMGEHARRIRRRQTLRSVVPTAFSEQKSAL